MSPVEYQSDSDAESVTESGSASFRTQTMDNRWVWGMWECVCGWWVGMWVGVGEREI